MPVVIDNPFAVLTAVVAPAILTNACSVLALGTANRIARVVDRTRAVINILGTLKAESDGRLTRSHELDRLQIRGRLLLRALRLFYAALGAFAASALAAVLGSLLSALSSPFAIRISAVAALFAGSIAVTALVSGSVLMVSEIRLAMQSIAEEVGLAHKHMDA